MNHRRLVLLSGVALMGGMLVCTGNRVMAQDSPANGPGSRCATCRQTAENYTTACRQPSGCHNSCQGGGE